MGKDGSIDWLCLPRFDADACFAALLGSEEDGRWLLAPSEGIRRVQRRYRPGSLVLETDFETDTGTLRVIDCMPPRGREPDLVREAVCLKGHVSVRMELAIRFGYGSRTPWVHPIDGRFTAMAGPDALTLLSDVRPRNEDATLRADFSLAAGERARFLLTWHPSHEPVPPGIDPATAAEHTEAWWREWSSRCTYEGPWREQVLLDFLESNWERTDEGIWEVRGPSQHFTHSKVMAWVAVDRALRTAEHFGLPAPLERWRELRARIHAQVCERGYDARRGSFVQAYGSQELDAALLLIPQLGFLPATDPRVVGTVDAIQRELCAGGLVRRYGTHRSEDGLPPGEGTFLACSFWLADALTLLCRMDEARTMFERLLSLSNDVGLLAEEYDPRTKRQLGNFPQAFSHVALINTAQNLTWPSCPITERPHA